MCRKAVYPPLKEVQIEIATTVPCYSVQRILINSDGVYETGLGSRDCLETHF